MSQDQAVAAPSRTSTFRNELNDAVGLKPFGITKFYTDGWGAYERHIDAKQHHVGKDNTQRIESKHINLRTRLKRLVRRTICFSKTTTMHDLVIGLFINRYEFGVTL